MFVRVASLAALAPPTLHNTMCQDGFILGLPRVATGTFVYIISLLSQ